MPEELVKVQLRREPFSVHLVWLGKEGKGRDSMIYVKGKVQERDAIAAGLRRHLPIFAGGDALQHFTGRRAGPGQESASDHGERSPRR